MKRQVKSRFKCHECGSEDVSLYVDSDEASGEDLLPHLGELALCEPFGPRPFGANEFAFHTYFSPSGEHEFACNDCGAFYVADIWVSNWGGQESFAKVAYDYKNEIEVEYIYDHRAPKSFVWRHTGKEYKVLQMVDFIRNPEHIPPAAIRDPIFGIYEIRTKEGYCRLEALPVRNRDGTKDWKDTKWYLKSADRDFARSVREGTGGELPRMGERRPTREIQEGRNLNGSAYDLIYVLENKLRWMIFVRLSEKYKKKHGENWWDAVIPAGIREKAALRYKEEQDNPYLSMKQQQCIFYCDFHDLLEILNKEWSTFGEVLKPKRTFEGKFEILQCIRNCVAHNRNLSSELFEELEKNVQDIYTALSKANIDL